MGSVELDIRKHLPSILIGVAFALTMFGLAPLGLRAEERKSGKVGFVLLHGKNGHSVSLKRLARSLRAAGALVEAPTMPWSPGRSYEKSYSDSLKEIDGVISKLRADGAVRIVVAGQSIGANVAFGYAARRQDLLRLVLLAPGHPPGLRGFANKVQASVVKAQKMIAAGHGNQSAEFTDINQGTRSTISTTAKIYLSWFVPDGPAVWAINASSQRSDIMVLCIDGTKERLARCQLVRDYLSRTANFEHVRVEADHGGVSSESLGHILAWLRRPRGQPISPTRN